MADRINPMVSGVRTLPRIAAATVVRRSSTVDPVGDDALQAGVLARLARNDRGEQRLLAGKPRIDGRLSGARLLRDLVDARALETSLEKHLCGGVENPLVDLAGEFAARPAAADKPPDSRIHSLF